MNVLVTNSNLPRGRVRYQRSCELIKRSKGCSSLGEVKHKCYNMKVERMKNI